MSQVVIYGAGKIGINTYRFLSSIGRKDLVKAFCDRNASVIKKIEDVPVIDLEKARELNLPFIIGVGSKYKEGVMELLSKEKIYQCVEDYCLENLMKSRAEYNRAYCAFFHKYNMEGYYSDADTTEGLDFFWQDGLCKKMFMKLNHDNIIELACGRGRHVPQYMNLSSRITLVDVLEKNIEICRERFKKFNNICYYQNNGKDLSDLPDSTYTSMFTYDAMVHFELLDIAKYLQECNRVLVPGGMALFHHSNNHDDYKASFCNAPHARSFMSKDIFAHLSDRAGLDIVLQETIDWGGVNDLDCLTLVRKPKHIGEYLG